MKCALCGREINEYDERLHRLKIDESHSADICQECIDVFLKWQQGIFAKLFPTSAAKKLLRQ